MISLAPEASCENTGAITRVEGPLPPALHVTSARHCSQQQVTRIAPIWLLDLNRRNRVVLTSHVRSLRAYE